MPGSSASATTSSASGGPSTSTASGASASSAAATLRAEPGPWWRTPKTLTDMTLAPGSAQLSSRQARYRSPQPWRSLTTVSRYSSHTTRSWTGSRTTAPVSPAAMSATREAAVAEVPREREPVRHDADRLGRAERAARRLQLRGAVLGHARPQLPEDRHDAADLVERLELAGQLELRPERRDAAAHDLDLLVGVVGQRQDDRVEASLERRRQLVDALVAVVRGRDDVEAAARLDLLAELGDRQRLLRQDADQRVLHVGRDPRQLLDAHEPAVLHRAHHRARRRAPRATGRARAAARSPSRSGSPPPTCPRCPARRASSRR